MGNEAKAIPQGVPAVRPQHSPGGPNGAAFAEEVIAHITANPAAWEMGADRPPVVEQVEFLLSEEVRERPGFNSFMPADTLLCVATLRGPFTISGPRGATPQMCPKALRVYHAHTGNYLGQGGLK